MGKYYEDFEIGEEAFTAGRTITEADIVMFAGLTGDWNELHTNKEYSERGPFKQRIAHGARVFSMMSRASPSASGRSLARAAGERVRLSAGPRGVLRQGLWRG